MVTILLCIYGDNPTRVVPYFESCMAPLGPVYWAQLIIYSPDSSTINALQAHVFDCPWTVDRGTPVQMEELNGLIYRESCVLFICPMISLRAIYICT